MIAAMAKPTAPLRAEHQDLLVHIEHIREAAREVPRLSPDERSPLIEQILGFLRGTLLPHAEGEEKFLYPEIAQLLGHVDATAPMIHDHVAIRTLADRLADTEASDVVSLQELLYGLHALITVHFQKEEEIYLPLLDSQPLEVTQEILKRIGERAGEPHGH